MADKGGEMADSDAMQVDLEKKVLPREYQLEILEQAKVRNTIAFLDTGCGKTLISVLLIKAMSADLRKDLPSWKCTMFMVPSVTLVYQQSLVLRMHTNLEVGHYCGDMSVDFWDMKQWKQELAKNQVLVMTPQIFLDCLRHSFMQMEGFNLLVFDECHHARGKHPYSLILDGFYHVLESDKRPRVFGMTASPLNKSGVQSRKSCAEQMQELEKKLDSSIYSLKDRTELSKFVPTPVESVVNYDKVELEGLNLEWRINMDNLMEEVQESQARNKSCYDDIMQIHPPDIEGCSTGAEEEETRHRFMMARDVARAAKAAKKAAWAIRSLIYVLTELGRWCASKAAARTLELCKEEDEFEQEVGAETESDSGDEELNEGYDSEMRRSYIQRAQQILQCDDSGPDVDGEPDEVLKRLCNEGWITPKVKALIETLLMYREQGKDFRCIVFVERIIAAETIALLLKALPFMTFLPCVSMTGHKGVVKYLTSKTKDLIIQQFKSGTLRLLVATDVVEEGLDVQKCSSVIRFNLSTSVRSHIQSRGRARQQESDYIMMVERGNEDHANRVESVRRSEDYMKMEALEQTQLEKEVEIDSEPVEVYRVESTGALVDDHHATSLLHMFCSKLPNDRYSFAVPRFQFEELDDSRVVCKVYLPSNAPESVRIVEGPPCVNKNKARQRVCLHACRLLHQCGALNDNLLVEAADSMCMDGEEVKSCTFPKNGKWFQESLPLCLEGDWVTANKEGEADPNGGVWLFAYGICFEDKGLRGFELPERETTRVYAEPRNYMLLMEKQMDVDISQMKVPLFFAHNVYSAAVFSPLGRIFVPWAKLRIAKLFHSWLFSRLLQREWSEDDLSVWSSARAYLILPMQDVDQFSAVDNGMGMINWKVVETMMYEIEGCLPDGQSSQGRRRKRGQGDDEPPLLDEGTLMTLTGLYDAAAVHDKIVTCNGKQYYVLSVLKDVTADSPFGDSNAKNRSKARTFTEYYAKKYGKVLLYPNQPMLKVRQFARGAMNLLHPRNNAVGKEQDGNTIAVEEDAEERTAGEGRPVYVEFLPPELCRVHVEFTPPFLRGALRLPSVLRRMECMMRAAELKAKIGVPICTAKVLEAITSAMASEGYSYEQYEFVGDGFLKLMVSVHLFTKYPTKHEGMLTIMRKRMVSNSNLCSRAVERGMGNILVAHQFDPSQWAAAGVALPPATVHNQDSGSHERCGENGSANGHANNEDLSNAKDKSNGDSNSDEDDGPSEKDACPLVMSDGSIQRKLHSKMLADVVEALVGVYYMEVGAEAALKVLSWFGIDLDGSHGVLRHTGSVPGKVIANDVDQVMEDATKCVVGSEVDATVSGESTGQQGAQRDDDMDVEESRAGNMSRVEEVMGYRFRHRKLLLEAFMHSSYADVVSWPCYQRLEFLGDALIDWITIVKILAENKNLDPGRLSVMRAMAVCNETLARVAVRFSLQQHLKHASSELMGHIENFIKAVRTEEEKRTALLSSGQENLQAYGLISAFAPKVLGDIVESVIGAAFVDSELDLRPVEKVCNKMFRKVTPTTVGLHPVVQFLQLCAQNGMVGELRGVALREGCKVEVFVDGEKLGEVINSQKKMARKLAAALGYQTLMSRLEAANGGMEDCLPDNGTTATGTEGPQNPYKRVFKRNQKKKDKGICGTDAKAPMMNLKVDVASVECKVDSANGGGGIVSDSFCVVQAGGMLCEPSHRGSGSGDTPSNRCSPEAEAVSGPVTSAQSHGHVARQTLAISSQPSSTSASSAIPSLPCMVEARNEGTAQGLAIVSPDGSLPRIVSAADVPTGGAIGGAAGQNYMPLAFIPVQPGAYSQYPAYAPLVGSGASPPIPFPFFLCPVLSPQGPAYVTVPYAVAPNDGPASPLVTAIPPVSPAAVRNNPEMEALLQQMRRCHTHLQSPSHSESPSPAHTQTGKLKAASPAAHSQHGELTPRGNVGGSSSRSTPHASPRASTSTEGVRGSDSAPATPSEGAWMGDRSDGAGTTRPPIVRLPQKARGSARGGAPGERKLCHEATGGRTMHEEAQARTSEGSEPQAVSSSGQEPSSSDSAAGVVQVETGRLSTVSDSEPAISTVESQKETAAEEASTATSRDEDLQSGQEPQAASPDKEVVSKIVNVLRIKACKGSGASLRPASSTPSELAAQGRHRAELNEICSQQGWSLDYCVVGEDGPGHMKRFTMKAMVDIGGCIHESTGESMPTHKKAKESAAGRLMAKLRETGCIF